MGENTIVSRYVGWLRGTGGVEFSEKDVKICNDSDQVIHGFGVVANRDIEPGTELFKIEPKACFGTGKYLDEPESVDSQWELALKLVEETKRGQGSSWAQLIETLPSYETFTDVPWLWGDESMQHVKGTELELPVENKLARLQQEFDQLENPEISFETFCRACGVVISHLNPFFGGCMVPFVYMLNCANDDQPNVAFEESEDGSYVIGTAVRAIKTGEELTQSYGDDLAAADLIYRCGFILKDVTMNDVISFNVDRDFKLKDAKKVDFLEKAGVVDASPWYGLDEIKTVQVGRKNTEGFYEFLLCCFMCCITDDQWTRLKEQSRSMKKPTSKKRKKMLDKMDLKAVVLCAFVDDEGKATTEDETSWEAKIEKLQDALIARRAAKDDEDLLWEILGPMMELKMETIYPFACNIVQERMKRLRENVSENPMMVHLREIELELCQNLEKNLSSYSKQTK